MVQRIVVNDDKNVKIGVTFPKRAKQLVSKQRAVWLDESHTEIKMVSLEEKVSTEKRVVTEEKEKKRSIVKDAYRDSESVVLSSTPIEIIKKSKRRTRELHAAFSAVLWVGAAILYFGISYLMGYTKLASNLFDVSWTWIVFIAAAEIECLAEVYFCKNELVVLTENIDLRQINPSKGGELDLWGYHKKLTRKIRIMSSAIIWIPLVLLYFICGYAMNLWNVAWVIFVIGLFIELLANFVKKLKKAD